jgi:hypothetical protein
MKKKSQGRIREEKTDAVHCGVTGRRRSWDNNVRKSEECEFMVYKRDEGSKAPMRLPTDALDIRQFPE